jgi:ankyrin repeat protein
MHSHHTTPDTPLILAVKSGDESKVKAAMANRVTTAAKNEAFLVACEYGQIEMAELVFRYGGIDVNYRGGNDKTPITWAIEKNKEALFNFLFEEKKAALDTLDSQGRSLLMLAVIYNSQHFVTRLLACGLRVEEKDTAGMNAFLYAASDGRLEMMEQFIKISPELINIPNNQNKTALMFVAEKDNEGAVNFLLQHDANPNAVDWQDYTALMYAIQMQDSSAYYKRVTSAVSGLLEKQEKTREAFNKLLCFALKKSNLPILEFLWGEAQKHVNDFNIVTEARAFLHIAAEQGDLTMTEYFLTLGGMDNLNAPNACGKTPLMLAIGSGNTKTVWFLLDKNAEVNVSDEEGNTPLIMAAASLQDEKIFNFLLAKNANVAVKNKTNRSALTQAAWGWGCKTSYVCALLRHHQGSRLTLEDIEYAYRFAKRPVFHEYFKLCHDLQQAVICGDLDGVKRFIDLRANVNLPLDYVHLGNYELKRRKVDGHVEERYYGRDGTYRTRYIQAKVWENYQAPVLEPVISSDLTSPNVPLVLAVKHANACPDGSIIKLLVKHGAEVEHCASLLSDVAQLPGKSSLEFLMGRGAKVGPDTLISAIRGGNKENIQYLLEVGATPHYSDWEQKIQDKKSKKVFVRIFIDHLNEKIKKALFEERDERAFHLLVSDINTKTHFLANQKSARKEVRHGIMANVDALSEALKKPNDLQYWEFVLGRVRQLAELSILAKKPKAGKEKTAKLKLLSLIPELENKIRALQAEGALSQASRALFPSIRELTHEKASEDKIEQVIREHLLKKPTAEAEQGELRHFLSSTLSAAERTSLKKNLSAEISAWSKIYKQEEADGAPLIIDTIKASYDSYLQDQSQVCVLFEILRTSESGRVNVDTGTWNDFVGAMERGNYLKTYTEKPFFLFSRKKASAKSMENEGLPLSLIKPN